MMDMEQLDAILIENGVDWDKFMDAPDGDIYLGQVLFSFRVGLYFEKPYETIMACKQFVRMRRIEAWRQFELKKLNAERPSSCLYSLPDEKGSVIAWRPTRLKADTSQSALLIAQQAAYQQASYNQQLVGQQYVGYPTTGLSGSYTGYTTLSQATLPTVAGCGTTSITSNTSGS